jgi:hypothetical protein
VEREPATRHLQDRDHPTFTHYFLAAQVFAADDRRVSGFSVVASSQAHGNESRTGPLGFKGPLSDPRGWPGESPVGVVARGGRGARDWGWPAWHTICTPSPAKEMKLLRQTAPS